MTVVNPYNRRDQMCPVCGKIFKGSDALAEHIKKEHPGVHVGRDDQ